MSKATFHSLCYHCWITFPLWIVFLYIYIYILDVKAISGESWLIECLVWYYVNTEI